MVLPSINAGLSACDAALANTKSHERHFRNSRVGKGLESDHGAKIGGMLTAGASVQQVREPAAPCTRLPLEAQDTSRRSERERAVRQRDRALAGKQPGVYALERHRRACRPSARERRARHECLTVQRVRTAAEVAVGTRRQTAISEGDDVAGARRLRLLLVT